MGTPASRRGGVYNMKMYMHILMEENYYGL